MELKQSKPQSFYRWLDGEGRMHVVSSLDLVPAASRGKATVVLVSGVDSYPASSAQGFRPDWASFAKAAVEQVNQRQKQQDEEIRKIQAEGH